VFDVVEHIRSCFIARPTSCSRFAHQLAPHRIRTFKLSNDPKFADKLRDVVGLYVDLPAHAVVLSVDEKSQIPLPKNMGGRAGSRRCRSTLSR
jgi:hypothetical protein